MLIERSPGGSIGTRSVRVRPSRVEQQTASLTITGVVHLIDVEPDRAAIRTASGVDWECHYPAELEDLVLDLISRRMRVRARGEGRLTSPRRGSIELAEVQEVPEYEQTSLFTTEPVPVDELAKAQSVRGPQGREVMIDPEWIDDEESRRFLEAVISDVE